MTNCGTNSTPSKDVSLEPSVQFLPQFLRNLKQLKKRYPSVKSDIQCVIDELLKSRLIGDQLSDVGDKREGTPFKVYKARAANSNSRKGKRGGYRIIYEATDPPIINLLIAYCKADQGNVYSWEIREILKELKD